MEEKENVYERKTHESRPEELYTDYCILKLEWLQGVKI